jgi:hypothetical protein
VLYADCTRRRNPPVANGSDSTTADQAGPDGRQTLSGPALGLPDNAAPSLQLHYRAFITTTGCSAPALRFGTLALAVGAACGLSIRDDDDPDHGK